MSAGALRIRVQRQDGRDRPDTRRWETFVGEFDERTTIADLLRSIDEKPVTETGETVAPIAFESACWSDGCAACTLLVNGHARAACRTRVAAVVSRGRVALAPLSKFPLVRDLIVDKSGVAESFGRTAASLAPDDRGGERIPRALLATDRCSECGACLEACPEWGSTSAFVGPAALNEARLLRALFAHGPNRPARLEAVMHQGGVQDCGKARSCVAVCPEKMPLFDSILSLERDATRHWLRTLLRR